MRTQRGPSKQAKHSLLWSSTWKRIGGVRLCGLMMMMMVSVYRPRNNKTYDQMSGGLKLIVCQICVCVLCDHIHRMREERTIYAITSFSLFLYLRIYLQHLFRLCKQNATRSTWVFQKPSTPTFHPFGGFSLSRRRT